MMNLDELIELQRQSWSEGTPLGIEELLSRTTLSTDSDQGVQLRLSLICSEIALREAHGQIVTMSEYLQRFPDLKNQLMIQWEVDRLLANDIRGEASTAPLSPSGMKPGSTNVARRGSSSKPLPSQIGRYEVLRELGRGAMGIAYEAWDPKLKRPVAIKRLRSGDTASVEELTRIRAEAEAVANIDHANIVKIYDIGEEDGNPFFAMELCTGGNLSQRLQAKPLPPRQAAELVRLIALGVSAAHNRRIIHRDLKPSNILLCDAEGWIPKVSDFGLAKSLDNDSNATATGFLMGTPAYMPPEQATGQAKFATEAMDIYALGTVLYECLTGRPPFQSSHANDVLEQVRNSEPISVRRLEPNIPIALETIVCKCMRKEPAQRYASARQLADDLQNYLLNRPIIARRQSLVEHALSWGKRNPLVATLLSSICLIVTGSLIVLSGMFVQVQAESSARLAALADRDEALQEKSEALKDREAANARLQLSEELAQRRYYSAQVSLAQQALIRQDYARAEDLLESVIPHENARDFRGFEWNFLKRAVHQNLASQFDAGAGEVRDIDLRPAQKLILVCGGGIDSGFASLRNYETGEILFGNTFGQSIGGGVFHPGHDAFIVCRNDGILYLYHFGNPTPVNKIVTGLALRSVAWSPDGSTFLVGSESGEVGAWDAKTWESKGMVQAERGPVLRMFFNKDGSRFYTSADWGGDGKHSSQWKLVDGRPELQLAYRDVSLSDESPDGRLVVGMNWGNLVIAATDTAEILRQHPISSGPLLSVRFAGDGKELYLASRNDREVRRVAMDSLEVLQVYPSQHTLAAVKFPAQPSSGDSAGGSLAPWVSGDAGGEVRLWDSYRTATHSAISTAEKAYQYATFVSGSRELLLSSNVETILWDPISDVTSSYSDVLNIVATSNDRRVIVSSIPNGPNENSTLVIHATDQSQPRTLQLAYPIYERCIALSGSGRFLATRAVDNPIDLFDLTRDLTDSEEAPVVQFDASCVGLTFSYQEDRLACGTQYGEVRAFDLKTHERLPNYSDHQSFWAWGMSAAYSRDGQLLASGNESGTIRVWRTASRELVAELTGNQGEIRCLAFFPDGKRLVSGGSGDVRIWDVEAGQELLSLPVSEKRAVRIAVSDDGHAIMAGTPKGRVHVWNANVNH